MYILMLHYKHLFLYYIIYHQTYFANESYNKNYFQLSYIIGYILFPNTPEMQIGMFFTGVSPSGGASNMWTVLLDGNLNLSITMTTLCTIAAFGKICVI